MQSNEKTARFPFHIHMTCFYSYENKTENNIDIQSCTCSRNDVHETRRSDRWADTSMSRQTSRQTERGCVVCLSQGLRLTTANKSTWDHSKKRITYGILLGQERWDKVLGKYSELLPATQVLRNELLTATMLNSHIHLHYTDRKMIHMKPKALLKLNMTLK